MELLRSSNPQMQKELDKFNAMERAKQIRKVLNTTIKNTTDNYTHDIANRIDNFHLAYLEGRFDEDFVTVVTILQKAQLSNKGLSKFWKIVNKNLISNK